MGVEIERKFLVAGDGWRNGRMERQYGIVQGYFPRGDGYCVRVRVIDGVKAFLTIKGSGRRLVRPEFEYPIPLEDAQAMMGEFCGTRIVSKVRHCLRVDGHLWEIDVFLGRHAPLVLAEIELCRVDESFVRPAWLGEEVTGDMRFVNEHLAMVQQ